jgi:hypothetical protein
MVNYQDERKELDRALEQEERWWGLEVAGWTILWFTVIPAVFIFVGLRSKSLFWLWCTAVLGLIGLVLTGTAAMRRLGAERKFQTEAMRDRMEQRLEGPELPVDESGRKAA